MTILLNPSARALEIRVDAERVVERARVVIARLLAWYTRTPSVSYDFVSGKVDAISYAVASVEDSMVSPDVREAASKALDAQLDVVERDLETTSKTPAFQNGVATKLNATGVTT